MCEQLAQSCYLIVEWLDLNPDLLSHETNTRNHYTTRPHSSTGKVEIQSI